MMFTDEEYLMLRTEIYTQFQQRNFKRFARKSFIALIRTFFQENFYWLGLIRDGSRKLYLFRETHYHYLVVSEICRELMRVLHDLNRDTVVYFIQIRDVEEIYKQLVDSALLLHENEEIVNRYPNFLPCENGVLNLIELTMVDSSPDFWFTFCVPAVYTPSNPPEEFNQFLEEILPAIPDRLKVLAYLSYCLTARIDLQMAQIWVGNGQNGKSELSQLLVLMLPGLVTHLPIDKLVRKGDRFTEAHLRGKFVNIGSEIDPKAMNNNVIDNMKRLITNKRLTNEKKGKDLEETQNFCRQLFDINCTPFPSPFMNFPFYRRFQIINFPTKIPDSKIVRDLMEKIWEAEHDAILYMLVAMHQNLEQYLTVDAAETEQRWMNYTHSVWVFHERHCVPGGETDTTELYNAYIKFCENTERHAESRIQFGRVLSWLGVKKYRRRIIVDNMASYYHVYAVEYSAHLQEDLILSEVQT